ncbi:hypothetical protein CAOG_07139 [Capsaspora owczarzaki ATCC 30864]|uniref:Uncharacterized protein n=1 Tax=Capsaspora owczarzaki (strain ATCC 30864) TaxID=595528 RepID=A0A0D2VYR4_CAPO3|nr:hypothetical protein CAOG_07139 [Capsaspora owczarzaki ATCC 30864]KJE96887.1 hypothetical protein CAOG_007139 [Capsaspora owczarzaki ATCC 30864]|eukprot:XP_004343863.1 hypothetical protein CAOG_07139 [Capsaspora owczarzaki ATCC 30864]
MGGESVPRGFLKSETFSSMINFLEHPPNDVRSPNSLNTQARIIRVCRTLTVIETWHHVPPEVSERIVHACASLCSVLAVRPIAMQCVETILRFTQTVKLAIDKKYPSVSFKIALQGLFMRAAYGSADRTNLRALMTSLRVRIPPDLPAREPLDMDDPCDH